MITSDKQIKFNCTRWRNRSLKGAKYIKHPFWIWIRICWLRSFLVLCCWEYICARVGTSSFHALCKSKFDSVLRMVGKLKYPQYQKALQNFDTFQHLFRFGKCFKFLQLTLSIPYLSLCICCSYSRLGPEGAAELRRNLTQFPSIVSLNVRCLIVGCKSVTCEATVPTSRFCELGEFGAQHVAVGLISVHLLNSLDIG